MSPAMHRLRRAATPLALAAALVVAAVLVFGESSADLDNLVFTSRPYGLRMIVPRGWRASDQQSPLGVILWMARSQPQGQMQLTAEDFNHELYCSWPVGCRTGHDSIAAKYACALRQTLQGQQLRVGPTQPGPKENDAAGMPSVWFEYDDGKHFLRQAIAISSAPDRAVSLVLSAPTAEARATHTRAFEQALRTLHQLSAEETSRVEGIDAAGPISDASLVDSGALVDGAVLDGGVRFSSAPASKIDPIGPCVTQ
jgi:hypothetical protein